MSFQEQRSESSSSFASFAIRWCWVYLLLYVFPFPFSGVFSIIGAIIGQFLAIFGIAVPALANLGMIFHSVVDTLFSVVTVPIGRLLGAQVLTQPTGSGDTAHAYIKFALLICISLVVAGVWHWRKQGQYPERTAGWAHVWGRWWLASCLLTYGAAKLFALQFSVSNPHELDATIGSASPMHLAWLFWGHSPEYQRLMGLAELIPALLVLHRRTALAGLLMLFGVLVNVFAVNLCFDIPVKLGSAHYLCATILLLLPYRQRILAFLEGDTALPSVDLYVRPRKISERRWGQITSVCGVALVLSVFLAAGQNAKQMNSMRKPSQWEGLWDVHSVVKDSVPWKKGQVQGYKSVAIDDLGRFSLIDYEGNRTTFRIQEMPTPDSIVLSYPFVKSESEPQTQDTWTITRDHTQVEVPNNKPTSFKDREKELSVIAPRIRLTGRWQGHAYEITAVRTPRPIHQSFRWVQEAPFQN